MRGDRPIRSGRVMVGDYGSLITTHPQFGLQLHDIAEIVFTRVSLAQPACAIACSQYFAKTFHCFLRPQFRGMVGNARQHIGNILADTALLMGARIDKDPFKPETAGLETIECINQIIVLFRGGRCSTMM